jgi:hypothetical protein
MLMCVVVTLFSRRNLLIHKKGVEQKSKMVLHATNHDTVKNDKKIVKHQKILSPTTFTNS